jgi:hypothetical protein
MTFPSCTFHPEELIGLLIIPITPSPRKISQSLLFRIKVIKSQEKKNETTSAPDRQASVGVLRRILVTTDDEEGRSPDEEEVVSLL